MYRIQYINRDRFESTSTISSVIGRAFHNGMDIYNSGTDDVKPETESEAITMGLETAMEFLDQYNEGFIEYSTTIPNKQKALDLLSFAYNSYVQWHDWGSEHEIIGSEVKIIEEIDIEWRGRRMRLPVPLKGYLDLLFRDDKGRIIIRDYKTTKDFSDPDKIDGAKMIQAVQYYLLVYALTGEAPYEMQYHEVKLTKNRDGSPQVRDYGIVFEENELYFDFYFRFYEDMTNALNGKMVYVPNINTFYDNEVSVISYIHRLDVPEIKTKMMEKLKVDNLTDLLKAKIQSAGNMRKLMKTAEKKFVSAKNLNYESMTNEEKIQTKMMEHGMMIQFEDKIDGSTVDLYRYIPSIGLKMSRIRNYADDVEQVLGKSNIRVLAPIPGSSLIGFEVPKDERRFPYIPEPTKTWDVAIGETLTGEKRRFDLREAPHMLVAGATGSGKSVFLNSIIEQVSKIDGVDLHLFDPKLVELAGYKNVAAEYLSDHAAINVALEDLVLEMEERYQKMQNAGVKNISEMTGMNYKVVVIDEFGDLTVGNKNVQGNVLILAQKARAAGIHMIVATQRPDTSVISGTIKANFPTKAIFRVAKEVDSRVVLDESGAEKLTGKGDMLFQTDQGIERLQGFNI